jgi:hypothetical protein
VAERQVSKISWKGNAAVHIGIAKSRFIGLAVALGTGSVRHITVLVVAPLGLGAVNIVLGVVMLITRTTDEARPE